MKTPNRFTGYNAGYAQSMYEQWLRDPQSVDEGWRRLFGAAPADLGLLDVPGAVVGAVGPLAADASELKSTKAAAELVDAYRLNGHFAAHLDPLGSPPRGHPTLQPAFHGITEQDLRSEPAASLVQDVIEWLRSIYTGTIGYEYEHLQDPERQEWVRQQVESGRLRQPLPEEQRLRLLDRLTEVESFEQFIHRAYLGAKRFSIEGTDVLVPMLDVAVEAAAAEGAREVVLGMAHRGRLNVLVHLVGRPYEAMIAEFEGQHGGYGTTGDVKYHLGAEGTYATASGEPLSVLLAPNPSHLEAVDPVAEGITRAKQSDRSGPELGRDEDLVMPVLIHGDAAFAGQGVVAETLNLARLDGYRTGGTLHVIANNQIGFTTLPGEGRSTAYASDLAKGFDIPIFHVNADDPEACLAVTRLAMAFRARFHADVVIDLVGYRRFGHNEADEPAYTQPEMYERIREHPTVREQWADRLVAEGLLSEDDVQARWDAAYQRLVEAQHEVQSREAAPPELRPEPETLEPALGARTEVEEARLRELDHALHSWPEGFRPNPKLERQLAKRAALIDEGGSLDWAHAEALAFGSLLQEGVPIRLTGQDTERGTFSQRHLVLHDVETGSRFTPLASLSDRTAPFEIHNSPLSELACLGFEYGYATAAAGALVLWEAQFGDFVNGAQIVLDQFVSAGRAKWGQEANLVLLLPHGYEGQGPEHSSARLERFLQLAAEDDIRVANLTTPAQYFHLLRRQAKLEEKRPLVLMTPKSLLRHPRAISPLADLTSGEFHFVLGDDSVSGRESRVRRAVLCSGKLYFDITGSEQHERAGDVAVLRVEQLYPFPGEPLEEALRAFPSLERVVWSQEEPANMGAWRYIEPRLRELTVGLGDVALDYAGRPDRASPAEGYANTHQRQQERIVRDALGLGAAAPAAAAPPRQTRRKSKAAS